MCVWSLLFYLYVLGQYSFNFVWIPIKGCVAYILSVWLFISIFTGGMSSISILSFNQLNLLFLPIWQRPMFQLAFLFWISFNSCFMTVFSLFLPVPLNPFYSCLYPWIPIIPACMRGPLLFLPVSLNPYYSCLYSWIPIILLVRLNPFYSFLYPWIPIIPCLYAWKPFYSCLYAWTLIIPACMPQSPLIPSSCLNPLLFLPVCQNLQ